MSAGLEGSQLGAPAERVFLLVFALLGPPVAWGAHFGVIYFVVAAVCASGGSGVLLPVGLATLVAAGASVTAGLAARRRWHALATGVAGEGGGSSRLLLAMGMLGAVFFTALILLEALPPLFLPPCAAGEP